MGYRRRLFYPPGAHVLSREIFMPRWIAVSLAIVVFAVLSLSIPATTFSHKAFASKMDGKPFGAESPKNLCFPNRCKGQERGAAKKKSG
jgi:hypothetical protein